MVESIQNHIDDVQRYAASANNVADMAGRALRAVNVAQTSLATIPKGGQAAARAAQAGADLQQLIASTRRYQQAARMATRRMRGA